MTMVAFVFTGIVFQSCKKDEQNTLRQPENRIEKVMSDFDLPIFIGQNMEIGYAMISHDPDANTVIVDIILDQLPEGWEVMEAHLYAAYLEPPTPAPGQFPFHWYAGDGPLGFTVDGPEWDCPGFEWYYALHLQLMDMNGEEETAWLLPEEGGMNWTNPKGKPMGWGEYFLWEFDWVPIISDITLSVSMDMISWDMLVLGEDGFELCMNGDPDTYYYLDGDMMSNVALEQDYLNPFYQDEVPEGSYFWTYWANKGVVAGATGWQGLMWEIITGTLPIFYVNWDGTDYQLIDGLQYQLYLAGVPGYTGEEILRINGDYPEYVYEYNGTLMGEYCESGAISIMLEVGCD